MKTQTVGKGNGNRRSSQTRAGDKLASPTGLQRIDAGRALYLGERAGELTVVAGRVWLTRAGDLRDHVLEPGERLHLGAGESAVIEPWMTGHGVSVRWKPKHASFLAAVLAELLQVSAFLGRRFAATCAALARGGAASRRGAQEALEDCRADPVASQVR